MWLSGFLMSSQDLSTALVSSEENLGASRRFREFSGADVSSQEVFVMMMMTMINTAKFMLGTKHARKLKFASIPCIAMRGGPGVRLPE